MTIRCIESFTNGTKIHFDYVQKEYIVQPNHGTLINLCYRTDCHSDAYATAAIYEESAARADNPDFNHALQGV